jgi:hypothetical protein
MTEFSSRMTQQWSASLTAKGLLMNHYQPQRALAAKVKLLLNASAYSTNSAQFCNAQLALMNAWNAEANEELQDKLTMTEFSVGQQILALKAAPLAHKHNVLSSMPIIDVQHAAGFLGITELALNYFNAFHHDLFGKCYMNRRHYSLDELMLINNNPEWLSDYRKPLASAAALTRDSPRCLTVVEEKVAMAFCNIKRDELPEVAYVISRDVSVYYLADLEEIRVAKWKREQA